MDKSTARRLPRLEFEPLIYGTVTLMTVFIVSTDDGINDFGDAASVVIGPMVASALAHLFATVLGHVKHHRSLPTRGEFADDAWHSAQFLLLTIVPLVLLSIGRATGWWSAATTLDTVADLGLLFLLVVGAVSGWHVARRPWLGAVVGAGAAALIGLVVTVMNLVVEHH
ncbi:hypothetical protein GCM10007304_33290 [Rhodococcoides trifolii]|uniref:Integral membrane protein n=1 Tax=Rhodococcoides trifolii TaxID=908250 RepID=A0A917G0J4_9NOCA|nr:hypothetical protein [Rhodococcus trifolii]GGG16508.1 hypothetical protein GCM10007304_33290 [Rhodococcus trifolii]